MAKLGERFAEDMFDRGRREIGGFFFPDSNIAQPNYPLRGNYGPSKEAEAIDRTADEPTFEELHPVGPPREDPGRDERGMDRE